MGRDENDPPDRRRGPKDRGATLRAGRGGPANAHPAFPDLAGDPGAGPRIPAELWPAAIAVTRVHGIHPTVAALKLNYYGLQRRLPSGAARQGGRAPAPVSAAGFVELAPRAMSGGASVGRGERGMVEWIHLGGARLIVHRGAAGSDELRAVVKRFLRHGR
jgi:hypothetical protein